MTREMAERRCAHGGAHGDAWRNAAHTIYRSGCVDRMILDLGILVSYVTCATTGRVPLGACVCARGGRVSLCVSVECRVGVHAD